VEEWSDTKGQRGAALFPLSNYTFNNLNEHACTLSLSLSLGRPFLNCARVIQQKVDERRWLLLNSSWRAQARFIYSQYTHVYFF
jgi:hypothetical protein